MHTHDAGTFDTIKTTISNEFVSEDEVDSVDSEIWIDPLTGKPSGTQTGVGLADLTQDARSERMPSALPAGYNAGLLRDSRIPNLLGMAEERDYSNSEQTIREAESESESGHQKEQDWSYLPGFHTAYWGNVGWLVPDGFVIDSVAMFRVSNETSVLLRRNIVPFLILKVEDIIGVNPSQSNPVAQTGQIWIKKIDEFFGFLGLERMIASTRSTIIKMARFFVPAHLYVAFGRQDATLSPVNDLKTINVFDVEGFLIKVANDLHLGLVRDRNSQWLGKRTSVLAPLFGFIYTAGPGFEGGIRKGQVTKIEDLQDTTVMQEPVLGSNPKNPEIKQPDKPINLTKLAQRFIEMGSNMQTLILRTLDAKTIDKLKIELEKLKGVENE